MKTFFFLLIIVAGTSCTSRDHGTFQVYDTNMSATVTVGSIVEYKKTNKIKRNDIIAFRNPNLDNNLSCLRIIGMPGERIEIIKGILFINNKEHQLPISSTQIYTVYTSRPNDFKKVAQYSFKKYNENFGMIRITKNQYHQIVSGKLIDSIYSLGFDSTYIYPQIVKVRSSTKFNHYYFGPVFVPQIGDTIVTRDKMLVNTFMDFSDDFLPIREPVYFCIGDSFSDAIDSRVLGLIPESKILGVVKHITNKSVINVSADGDL